MLRLSLACVVRTCYQGSLYISLHLSVPFTPAYRPVVSSFILWFFVIWVLWPFQEHFTYIEPIVHQRCAKTGEPGKSHLTIRKQNFAFPHVTRARLEPQRRETIWIKSQLSYPLGYGGPLEFFVWFLLRAAAYLSIYVMRICTLSGWGKGDWGGWSCRGITFKNCCSSVLKMGLL